MRIDDSELVVVRIDDSRATVNGGNKSLKNLKFRAASRVSELMHVLSRSQFRNLKFELHRGPIRLQWSVQ